MLEHPYIDELIERETEAEQRAVDEMFNSRLAGLIEIAKTKFGEAVYEYRKIEHHWSSDRTRSGRAKSSGSYYTTISGPGNSVITKEEYEANVAQGEQDNADAFMLRKRGGYYYTYRRKVLVDGWREHLTKILSEVK